MIIKEKPDLTMEFVKYGVSKRKVTYLLEKLKAYSADSHEFKEIEESFENELKNYQYPNDNEKTKI